MKQIRLLPTSKKLFLNAATSLSYNVLTILVGLILPRMYITTFGSAVNGLISSISQFLGFIAIAECGVGAVIKSAYYKPLAQDDNRQLSRVFKSSQNFFSKIGILLIIYTAFLVIAFPRLADNRFDRLYTISLIIILAFGKVVQYFIGSSYRILLDSDQLCFAFYSISIATLLINTVICIVLMKCGASIQIVKGGSVLIHLCEPLLMQRIVRKNYYIDRKIILDGEPIEQKWNGLAQHIASIVLEGTDVAVLTTFSTLENVSVYSVYNMIVSGIKVLVQSLCTGVGAVFGKLLAKDEKEELLIFFCRTELIAHYVSIMLFTITGILLVPFVRIYTADINDADYIVPTFGIVLTCAQAMRSLQLPYNLMVHAAGHFRQTQHSAIIEAAINVGVSIAAVFRWGLVGVAIGTFTAIFYRILYLARYLSRNIIHRSMKYLFHYLACDVMCVLLSVFATKWMMFDVANYLQWVILAVKVSLICIAVFTLFFFLSNRSTAMQIINSRKSKT